MPISPDIQKIYLALDQGTTSSRTIAYSVDGKQLAVASRKLDVSYPQPGWVEQEAKDIWETQRETIEEVLLALRKELGEQFFVSAFGLSNQRETVLAWDKKTGKPLSKAIVWQCRRTTEMLENFGDKQTHARIREKTGLLLDPYFSASKISWLLSNVDGLESRAVSGEVVFGTVDSWIIYKLTNGRSFYTDVSNASRTLLFSLNESDWDEYLLECFSIKKEWLAEVRPSLSHFGNCSLFSLPNQTEIPISAVLGDQQAALFGQGCESKGASKCTFGTGAFLLTNSGGDYSEPSKGVLRTVAWSSEGSLDRLFALEGSIFIAGALIDWLANEIELLGDVRESAQLAASVDSSAGVVFVPAFSGLGAPHWQPEVRGAVFGLTRGTTKAHLVRAALEGIAHQVADVLELPEFSSVQKLKIDGGMSKNEAFCQILADICDLEVEVSELSELSAYGAARAASVSKASLGERGAPLPFPDVSRVFAPAGAEEDRGVLRGSWAEAIRKLLA